MFHLKGVLKVKSDTQVVSDKFKKREFVLTDNSSQYPQHCVFQLTQDRTELIEPFREGETITVHFNLRGREWTSPQNEVKYFNSLEAWRIEKDDSSAFSAPSSIPSASQVSDTAEDDLPF
jgi:hypothetical protein